MSISLNTLETFGFTTKQIITEMEENFPPFNPSPSDSMQVLMYKAGQRSVVEWFIDKLQEQE
jgi:hypothetical protein